MLELKNLPYSLSQLTEHQKRVDEIHRQMEARTSTGAEFLGWLDAASKTSEEELQQMKTLADKIRRKADVLVVAGIGGSYLGAHAMIEALRKEYQAQEPEIIFCGNHMSAAKLQELLEYLEDKTFYVNVISKSGRTIETALAFRFLRRELQQRYGERAGAYIIATTDATSGALRAQVEQEGYESFVVPEDIGGRYSVMSPVGLFPMAVAGISIDDFLQGMKQAEKDFSSPLLEENLAYQYGLTRQLLYADGKNMEILVNYEPALVQFSEWYKQLFGESEGKDGKGIFPVSVANTTDLHSMGQMIQDGQRNFFETVLDLRKPSTLTLPSLLDDGDGLSYLEGEEIFSMTRKALLGTLLAHEEAGVPNLLLEMKEYSAKSLGYLMYFMMKSCAMSAYHSGVNPFDQPGVEAYKNNMLALLGDTKYAHLKGPMEEKLKEKKLL